jgi:hypothetical protein
MALILTTANRTGNVRITQHCGEEAKPLLQWKRNILFCVNCKPKCHYQQYKNTEFCTKKCFYGEFNVAGNNET